MRNNFSFGELGSILSSSKKSDVVKIASGVAEDNAPIAEAMESVCRVADVLDEMGKPELADELMSSAKSLISEKLKVAVDEEAESGESEGSEGKEKESEETEEVMSVKCPHCEKEFDVVVECEDNECEVEVEEGQKEEKEEKEEGQEETGSIR